MADDEHDDERDDDERDDEPLGGLAPPPRRIRHIMPLGMRVLVRVDGGDERSPGGLYLPQGVAEKHQQALYAQVIEVARAAPDGEEPLGGNVSGVPDGAWVLIAKCAGVQVPWDASLRLVETKEVLATVEELPYERAH